MQQPVIVGRTIDVSAEVFSVHADDVIGRGRQRPVVYARQCAMSVLRKRTNFSFPTIGKFFDRDHTTVMSACRQVERTRDPLLREGAHRVLAGVDAVCHPHAIRPRSAMLTVVDLADLHEKITNTFGYHPPSTPEIISAHERVREVCATAAHELADLCPDSDELDDAIKALELAMFHANAVIARTQSVRST